MLRPLAHWSVLLFAVMLLGTACAAGDAVSETASNVDSDVDEQSQEDPATSPDAQAADEDPSATTPAPVLSVVATVAPLADLVAQVGGDRVHVVSLVPAGGDAHTYEPRPQDVVLLSDADAYLGIGLDLNAGALRLAEENLPAGAPVVLLGDRALNESDLVFDHSHDHDDGQSHDQDDGHTHDDDGHTHDDDGHTHGEGELGPNPHVWTSLRNAAALVSVIADELGGLDPDGAEQYASNAQAFQDEIASLDQLIQDATETIPAEHRTLVTYHDAWIYFARDYGLEYATAVQPADFSEPSAAEVRQIIDLVRELDVPVVFGSEVFPTPVLETIAEETGAAYVANLSDDVLPGSPGDPEHSYLELMRRNAHAVVDGLGGDASLLGGPN